MLTSARLCVKYKRGMIMKFYRIFALWTAIVCLVGVMSGGWVYAVAGTPINNDMAVKYYDQCLANAAKDGTMFKANAKNFCECTAQNMKNNLSQEELQALQGQGQAARNVINKILVYVNGPCMKFPVNDLVLRKCMKNIGNEKTCTCLSGGVSTYLAKEAPRMLADVLDRDPNITDPLGAIMNAPAYKIQESKIAMQCASS